MSTSQMILEYLKVLLSAPPVWAACALVLVSIFKSEIVSLIKRIGTIKTPFGEFSTSQRERTEEVKELASATTAAQPSDLDMRLPDELKNLPPAQQERLREFIEAESARARLWEFQYLNRYLVRNTQTVLD